MVNIESNVSAPKTVNVDTQTSLNETNGTSSIRYTCDVVVNFENRVKTESRRIIVDPESGRKILVFPKGSIESLKDGTQSYYDRALLAESKNKTSFHRGLAGGVVIGAGVVCLILHISKKIKEKRKKGEEKGKNGDK